MPFFEVAVVRALAPIRADSAGGRSGEGNALDPECDVNRRMDLGEAGRRGGRERVVIDEIRLLPQRAAVGPRLPPRRRSRKARGVADSAVAWQTPRVGLRLGATPADWCFLLRRNTHLFGCPSKASGEVGDSLGRVRCHSAGRCWGGPADGHLTGPFTLAGMVTRPSQKMAAGTACLPPTGWPPPRSTMPSAVRCPSRVVYP
jgi:hypothetical protein